VEASAIGIASHAESPRRLALHLVVHEIRREYAGTVLGVSWAVLQPLMLLGAYFFLFTVLRVVHHVPHGALGQVGIILSGIVPWLFFMHSFSRSLGVLDQHAALVKQINFPIGVLPFVSVGVFLIDFGIGLVMLLALSVWQGWVTPYAVTLIPTALLMMVFLVGLTALLAPLGAMLRDLRAFLPVIVRLGIWISPVLYLPGAIPQRFQWVAYINPLTYFLSLVRFGAFGPTFGSKHVTLMTPLQTFGIAIGVTVILALAGYWAWGYVRRVAIDYL
jgi:homopolymeric O-antigen transport system permease protein